MKEQQCSIAKRMKYVALQDLQIRAVPRPVVHLIPGVIILTLPFLVCTPYTIAITFIIKSWSDVCEINLLQSLLENVVVYTAVAAVYV